MGLGLDLGLDLGLRLVFFEEIRGACDVVSEGGDCVTTTFVPRLETKGIIVLVFSRSAGDGVGKATSVGKGSIGVGGADDIGTIVKYDDGCVTTAIVPRLETKEVRLVLLRSASDGVVSVADIGVGDICVGNAGDVKTTVGDIVVLNVVTVDSVNDDAVLRVEQLPLLDAANLETRFEDRSTLEDAAGLIWLEDRSVIDDDVGILLCEGCLSTSLPVVFEDLSFIGDNIVFFVFLIVRDVVMAAFPLLPSARGSVIIELRLTVSRSVDATGWPTADDTGRLMMRMVKVVR